MSNNKKIATDKSGSFTSYFSLVINGENLITPGTKIWMGAARLLVIIMALAEAFSWGYLGSRLGNANHFNYFAMILMGLAIFLLVWVIDTTLMTLDRGAVYYDKNIFHSFSHLETNTIAFFKFFKNYKAEIGMAVRVIMVAGTMYVTAPFLSELFFSKDIQIRLEKKANIISTTERKNIVHVDSVYNNRQEFKIDSLQKALNKEIAGEGIGKKDLRGYGIAALHIDSNMKAVINEYRARRLKNDAVLARFDRAVNSKDYNTLGQVYNLNLPQNSFEETSKEIKPIIASDDGNKVESAVQWFLALIFTSLLVMKLFEPRGVKIYLSGALQDAYQIYLAGGYDEVIEPYERVDGESPMRAYRFEEFMLNTYTDWMNKKGMVKVDLEFEVAKIRIQQEMKDVNEKRDREETRISAAMNILKTDYNNSDFKVRENEAALGLLQRNVERKITENGQMRANLQKMREARKTINVTDGEVAKILMQLTESITIIDRDIADNEVSLSQDNKALATLNIALEIDRNIRGEIENKIKEKEKLLKSFDALLDKLIIELSELYLTHGKTKPPLDGNPKD